MNAPTQSGRGPFLELTGAGVALIAVSYGLARFGYGLFVPAFREEFALDATMAGTVAAGSYVSYCVAVVIATLLTPRLGARALGVGAGVVATSGVALIATAPTGTVLAVGVILAGASAGVASPALAHAVAETIPASRQDRTQTVINAGTGIGVAVAGPIALLTQHEWRVAWGVLAGCCAAATLWAARAIPAPGRNEPDSTASTPLARLLPRPLFPPGSARLITGAALVGAASAGIWTFGRDVLVTDGGLSPQISTIAWILLGVFGSLGAVAGDVVRRVGIRTGWSVTVTLMATSIMLFAAFPARAAVASLAAAGFGATYIALSGLLLIWGTRVYPAQAAAGVGLAFLVIALGQAAGAPIIGMLTGWLGAQGALAAAAVLALVAAFIRPTNRNAADRR